jgi:EF-hand domain-containing protein 1
VKVPSLPKPAKAPYNGYGTLLDSEQNCRSLVPKPPKKDLRKLVNKDGMVLRFVCIFHPRADIGFDVQQADRNRQFVLSYFMNDDTIAVFEPPIRNSGIIGGKFLERGMQYKRGTEEPFTYKDLYVGAEIVVNTFNFMLVNADEYTFSYMENNKHLFIMGDGQAVLKLLKAQVEVR